MLKLFSLLFIVFSILCAPISASAAATTAIDPMTTDPRHVLVKKVRADFATEITERKVILDTSNGAVALVDMAREYLEAAVDGPCDYIPSHPNWALVIQHILLGYGYDLGVAETLKVKDADLLVLGRACTFSCAYLVAQGRESAIRDEDIYGNPTEVSEVISRLRWLIAAVPDDIQVFARENVTKLGYGALRTFNAWSSHERFWAVAGVSDPKIPGQLRTVFTAFAGNPFGFVTDLTNKLDHAISHMAADPDAQSVVDLLHLSQQVLMTLAAGTPGDADEAWVRLNPSNTGEWEIIRKALFLALSVSSNPESAGRTFLSTLYDCGSYYPKKTDGDDVKTYYWRLEAFARGFATIWQGLQGAEDDAAVQALLAAVVVQANPGIAHENFITGVNRTRAASGQAAHAFKVERSPNHAVLMETYDASIRAITVGTTRAELAASLALHLEHDQAFRALYPNLIPWVTYHEPSARAKALVSGAITNLELSDDFIPQGVHLIYQGGRWTLKALQLDATGNPIGEAILWQQGASVMETLVGELANGQGRHLFSFAVNGANATIKMISSSYITKVGGEGATVVVAHGQEVGVMESSAYPWEVDTVAPENTSAISINSTSYTGSRGLLVASRGSVWVNSTSSIDTLYWQGFEVRQHNGKPYNFFSIRGQGFEAFKNVVLQGQTVVAQFSMMTAGQNVTLMYHPSANTGEIRTHGSYIKAGNAIEIDHNNWWGDTQTVFAGTDGSSRYQIQADLIANSARAVHEFGRFLKYIAWNINFFDDAEREALARGPHVYGAYLNFCARKPRFS